MRDRATATLTTVLVDDEPLAREELKWLLADFPEIEVIATAENGTEALELIEDAEPDIVFLDVQMPGIDGISLVRRIRERGISFPYFVFSTAFDQYAVEAFRLEAMDYVLKPVDKLRLAETIERAKRMLARRDLEAGLGGNTVMPAEARPKLNHPHAKIVVRNGNRHFIIDAQDMIYATINEGTITIVSSQVEGISSYRTLEELQANLDSEQFWRAHRSYLVNIHKIREVVPWFKSSYQIRVDDKKGTEIPVSRVQTRRLRELLKL
jgi:two-component system LytT family response regulator/two-component system response regulator LytT